jgi:hypothetical protein
MAKKANLRNVKRSTSATRSSDAGSETESINSGSDTNRRDYKEMFYEFAQNPAVRYVAGGIATAVLSKLATNLSERYPEISNFIKENLDTVEGKLGDFRNSLEESATPRQH